MARVRGVARGEVCGDQQGPAQLERAPVVVLTPAISGLVWELELPTPYGEHRGSTNDGQRQQATDDHDQQVVRR